VFSLNMRRFEDFKTVEIQFNTTNYFPL